MSRIPLVLRKVMPLVLFLVFLFGTLTEQPSHLPRTNHGKSSLSLVAPSSNSVKLLRNIWACTLDPGGICPPSTTSTQPNADNGCGLDPWGRCSG
jgi:hypothetical protein